MLMWDWQSLSLLLAGLMCLLFFIVAAYIYWQHSRYWKKLEQMERGYNAGKFYFNGNRRRNLHNLFKEIISTMFPTITCIQIELTSSALFKYLRQKLFLKNKENA